MVQQRQSSPRRPLAEAERTRRRAILDREYQAFPGYAAFDVARPGRANRGRALIVDRLLGALAIMLVSVELAQLTAALVRLL